MGKWYVDSGKKIIKNVESIDDIIDNFLEPYKDISDTVTDITGPIKAISSMFSFYRKRKFKAFLKGCSAEFHKKDFDNIDFIERFKKYLKNEKNSNFINNTIENAINSKSIYGSIVLGHFAGRILVNNLEFSFKELIVIEGVKELNDFEFSCFVKLFNKVNLSKEVNINEFEEFYQEKYFFELTIEKLINLRILERPEAKYGIEIKGRFISTEIAEDIFYLIDKIGLKEKLLNYQ